MKVRLYPERKDTTGFATEFVCKDGSETVSCFMAAQEQSEDTGNRKFNWNETKIWVRLTQIDTAALLRVLENNDVANIYYQNEKGWVRLEASVNKNTVSLVITRSVDGEEYKGGVEFTPPTAKLLSVFLREALNRTFDFRFQRKEVELATTAQDNNQPF